MPRQGQRGVNPLCEFGVCGLCPLPLSVAFATSPPQGGRLIGGYAATLLKRSMNTTPNYRSNSFFSAGVGQQVWLTRFLACQSPIERRVLKPTRPSAPPTS